MLKLPTIAPLNVSSKIYPKPPFPFLPAISELYRMRYLLAAFVFLLCSCSSDTGANTNKTDSTPPDQRVDLKAGSFADFSCSSNTGNQYTVYVPAGYTKDRNWPLVIFFDAHGNGHLPLEKYKSIADKWGFILAGSNSSRNGMKAEVTLQIGHELVQDLFLRFAADEDNLIVCGFSGGARVAANLAAHRTDIKALVCNSAAPQEPLANQAFIGLAGLGDMNYLEMRKFVSNQAQNKRPHELLAFDGKHEWAPAKMMEEALLLGMAYDFITNGMKQDTAMTNAIAANITGLSDSIRPASCLMARNLLQSVHNFMQNGAPNAELKKKLDQLNADACLSRDEKAWKEAEEKESTLQQELSNALLEKDSSWWKANAASYFETKSSGAEKYMRARVRGYMSLMCYTYCNQSFHMNNLHAAEKMTNLYSIIDPENSEWAYLRATFYAKVGLNNYVMPMLQKAVELGFSERSRLENDANFAAFRSDPAYQSLIGQMR